MFFFKLIFARFDTSVGPLIYADQYIEFSTSLVNNYFYGIGEHRDNLAHTAKWNGFTLWNRDVAPTVNFFHIYNLI